MTKKVVKVRKWKVFSTLLILLILVGFVFGVYSFIQIPIKNIIIKGTTYLNDDTVLELAQVKDYPKFFLTWKRKTEQALEKSDYIAKATVHKKWGFVFEIVITENQPLFWNVTQNQFVLDKGISVSEDEISKNFRVPRLLNYVPDVKYQKFIDNMGNIKKDVLSKISDIEYQPNDYDKDRFLLYMDDGNMVYLTLTKFKMINHYNDVLKQLENHKGILYLDNGNHFQIKE